MESEVAFWLVQFSALLCPEMILAGVAISVMVGAAGVTLIVTEAVAVVPFAPVAVATYVVVCCNGPTVMLLVSGNGSASRPMSG